MKACMRVAELAVLPRNRPSSRSNCICHMHMTSQALVWISIPQSQQPCCRTMSWRLQHTLHWQKQEVTDAGCAGKKLGFHVETPLTHFVHKLQNLTVPKTVAQVSLPQLEGTPSLERLPTCCSHEAAAATV